MISSLLFLFAAVLEPAEPVIEATPVEVIAEKQEARDQAQLERLTWDAMVATHGPLDANIAVYCVEETPGAVDVYSEPIRYLRGGVVEPIEMVWTRGLESVYESVNNSVGAHIYKDGSVLYRDADFRWGVRVSPVGLYFDDAIVPDEGGEWRFSQSTASMVGMDGPWPLGIAARWRVGRGKVKETLTAQDALRTALAKVPETKRVTLVSRVEVEDGKAPWIVTLGDQNRTAVVRDADTGAVFTTFTEPVIIDAAGESINGTYSYADGLLGVDIDPAWLMDEKRAYPIEIDPTVDVTVSTEIQQCGSTGGAGDENRVWVRFDLPAITGTCDSVDFLANLSGNSLIAETFTLSVFTTADATAWTSSTACATMDAFTYYDPSVSLAFTVLTGTGVKTWAAIDGPDSDANAITYLYDGTGGVCNPGYVTVKIQRSALGSSDVGDTFHFSVLPEDEDITFDAPGVGTPPKLTITYTGSLGCAATGRKGSGSVGMIQ